MKTQPLKVKINAFFLFIFIAFGNIQNSFCQADYPPPSGIWCSCPPSNGRGTGSVVPAVAEKDYVQGILVRVVWSDLEPTNDIYDWSLIDDQITAANTYEKNISLAVGGGPNSPDWLYDLGADSIHYDFPFSGTIPVPWDSTFLAEWTDLITDLGERYQNDTTIQLVYMTNATSNGFEMQMPFSPSPTYEELEYTEEKVINSWRTIIDQFNAVFPNHYLTNDFHPVNTSDDIADAVYAYATETVGERYGANAWWWTQNNTEVYPAQYEILQNAAENNIFSGVQFAKSGVSDSASFGPGGLPVALELAIENDVCYWEIWNSDIVDGRFDSLFAAAKCERLVDDLTIKEFTNMPFNLFPNPTTGDLTITMNQGQMQEISIYNAVGKLVRRNNYNESQSARIDLNTFKPGIYFVHITSNLGEEFTERIILTYH